MRLSMAPVGPARPANWTAPSTTIATPAATPAAESRRRAGTTGRDRHSETTDAATTVPATSQTQRIVYSK